MNSNTNSVDYEKWERVIFLSQLIIAIAIFITEVVGNIMLYVTRSQGYGPDTIVEKLLRYLVLTTAINFGIIIVSQIMTRRKKSKNKENYEDKRMILMIATILICTDVAFSHYQFTDAIVIFLLPIMISILYEDIHFSNVTLIYCFIGMTIAIVARGNDSEYNKDIGPEAAIAYSLLIGVYIFARVIMKTLLNRRNELGEALIESEKMTAAEERVQLSLKMFETLARALDAKDKYTNGHSLRVAIYSSILAEKLGFSKEQIDELRYEALLHDIGKIGVPDSILNKPDKLSEIEFNLIKSHTIVGADILKDMASVPDAKYVARYHHERYDGKGYPKGLKGEEIPLNARIVCIADSYDAMNSDRIYRKALSREVIRKELVKGKGTQFDPELLDLFLEAFDEHKLRANADNDDKPDKDNVNLYVMDDIEQVLWNITQLEKKAESASNLEKLYIYMRNIGIRYNRDINILCIDMVEKKTGINEALEAEASGAMERAIKKSIRAVDVYYKFSNVKHFVICLDAGMDNLDVIAQRIIFEFNETEYKDMFTPEYELSEANVTE